MITRATPSLRIARLVVQNFRTFHGATEIPLASGEVADEVAVLHGGNGTGKSNALAALDLFFRASAFWLRAHGVNHEAELTIRWEWHDEYSGFALSARDWPPGVREPLVVTVDFAGAAKSLSVSITPAGNEATLRLDGAVDGGWPSDLASARVIPEARAVVSIRNRFETPLGPGSKPLFRLDARRRDYRFAGEGAPPPHAPSSALSTELANRLLELATSLDPIDTERWRAFTKLVARFKTLQGREVAVLRMPDGTADLRFEIRGKQILRVSELSSGEQQVVALCAAVLTSRAAIVAIEEPEISLHPDYQELVRDVLREQVRSGLVDQIILESHVPIFDGPEVIRFSRSPDGATSVVRQASDAGDELRVRAKASGAEDQWVTPEGYTKLPNGMVESLGLQAGGHVWFMPGETAGRWEAWNAAGLDRMFGLPSTVEKK